MQTIVTTSAPQDFLALVPELVGFQPRNSVVLVAFRGKRTCAALRFDSPTSTSSQVLKRISLSLIGTLCKIKEADAVVPVVYTDEKLATGTAAPTALPQADFVRAVVARARLSGFLVRDALCQAPDGWASYLDGAPVRHPITEIDSSPARSRLSTESRSPVAAAAELPPVTEPFRAEVERLVAQHTVIRADPARYAGLDAEVETLDDVCNFFEKHITGEYDQMDERAIALMLSCVQGPPIRDAILLQCAFGLRVGQLVMDDAVRFADGEPILHEELCALLLGDGPRPDVDRTTRAITLMKLLVASTPKQAAPPALVMLAWLNWALGRGSVAGIFLDQALAIDGEYGMATLLNSYFSAGYLPEWAFADRRE